MYYILLTPEKFISFREYMQGDDARTTFWVNCRVERPGNFCKLTTEEPIMAMLWDAWVHGYNTAQEKGQV